MRLIFFILAIAIATSLSAQETRMVMAVGQGRTPDEAKADLYRKAIEEVSGIVVTSNLEANKKRLTKDEVGNYSAGYIEKYVITNVIQDKNGYTVEADVWVRPSKMADQKLNAGKDQKSLDGNRLGTQLDSFLNERGQVDNLFRNLLDDYPQKAFSIKQGQPEFKIDSDRTLVISIPFEYGWDRRYVTSLIEAMNLLSNKKQSEYAITVALKKAPTDWMTDVHSYYINDRDIYLTITNTLVRSPSIYATIFDDENTPIYKDCLTYGGSFIGDNRFGSFHITGNTWYTAVYEIKIRSNSKVRNKLKSANKIELSVGISCPN